MKGSQETTRRQGLLSPLVTGRGRARPGEPRGPIRVDEKSLLPRRLELGLVAPEPLNEKTAVRCSCTWWTARFQRLAPERSPTPVSGASPRPSQWYPSSGSRSGDSGEPALIHPRGQARETIETWRLEYNAVRPHGVVVDVPLREFEQLTLDRATGPLLSS